MTEEQQQTIDEAQKVEEKATKKKAQKEFDQAVAAHKQRVRDFKNSKIQVDRVIDEAADLSCGQTVQTDLVKGLRISSLVERFKFEKHAEAVEKAQATYIGSLKQMSKMIDKKLSDAEMNPPEAAEFGL